MRPQESSSVAAGKRQQLNASKQDELFQKIDLISCDIANQFRARLTATAAKDAAGAHNVGVICDHLITELNEANIKASTKEGKVKVLLLLSQFHNQRPFEQMTKTDVLAYLNSLRKPLADDPTQRWIGTYNGRQMIFLKFFKWLYNPDEPDNKKRITPPCMSGVKQLPRKDKNSYKPDDLWDAKEHSIFLKYCPSKRDRCYHAMANDTSARPHEILALKIGDVVFKQTDDNIVFAEILIKGGKTGSRTLPLIDSIPYLKDWMQNGHPAGSNPDAWLFVSDAHQSFGNKLTRDGLWKRYQEYYRQRYFPKLLKDETVPPADKAIIKDMLTKPWNLYVHRHSALTEKSQMLTEANLRNHAGWTMTSKMPAVYLHFFGNESSKKLLEAKGIIKRGDKNLNVLRSKPCPHCNEANKPDAQFCMRCRLVLDYDSYKSVLEEKKMREDEVKSIREEMNQKFDRIMKWIQEKPELAQVKPEVLLEKVLTANG